jgi:hypothetical protein
MAAGISQYPSSQNVFVKDHEATNKMVVDFSRNAKDFKVNNYIQITPVKKIAGYYLKMTVEEAGRLLSTDGSYFIWPDGNEAREGNEGLESFRFVDYLCKRFQFPVTLGDRLLEQASWDIFEQHVRIKTQQAMTWRTQQAITTATTTGNYDNSHVLTVSTITGNSGTWDNSTTVRSDIKRSFNVAANLILLDTLSAVNIDDLMVVMSPTCARQVAESQEVINAIIQSPDALAQVRGELPGRNVMFGLPDKLFGFPIVVEDAVKVTSAKGATRVAAYVLGGQTPFMCSRPGKLEGVAGAPSFSTLTCFMYEEMTVERLRDENNRRTLGRVVEDYTMAATAPVTGVLFQGAVTTN